MAESKSKKNIFQILLKLLSTIVIAFVCLITFFLLYYIVTSQLHAKDENYRPGISIYTIVSPSMNPVIKVYDIVVNAKVNNPKDIQIGDIITYKSKAANSEGMTITHRVVAIDKTQDGIYEYMTQGDNNSEPDSLFVTFDQVIGKEIMIIPKAGKLQFLIANRKSWLLLLLIPIGIYLLREVFRLIDLFGLRKKVVKITEQPVAVIEPKLNFQEIEAKKEEIKERLVESAANKESLIKSSTEPDSFLEQYTETKLEVRTNKYADLKKKKETKEIVTPLAEEKVVSSPSKVETQEAKPIIKPKEEDLIVLPKKKEQVNEEYEILDTDELSSKIKEYDTKLIQLNKMIADIENIKEKEEPKEEPFIEVDDFLKGGKIKVKKIEETKNQKKQLNSKKITEPSKHREEIKIELTPLVSPSSYNSRTKIARPDSVDINEVRNLKPIEEKPTKKKKSLNLNPKEVNKVKKTTPTKKASTKKQLALNPRTTQKATRNRKTTKQVNVTIEQQPVKKPVVKTRRKREPFIIIEKIK